MTRRSWREAHTATETQRRQKQVDSILKPNKKPPLHKHPHATETRPRAQAASWRTSRDAASVCAASGSVGAAEDRPWPAPAPALFPGRGVPGRSPLSERHPREEGRRGARSSPGSDGRRQPVRGVFADARPQVFTGAHPCAAQSSAPRPPQRPRNKLCSAAPTRCSVPAGRWGRRGGPGGAARGGCAGPHSRVAGGPVLSTERARCAGRRPGAAGGPACCRRGPSWRPGSSGRPARDPRNLPCGPQVGEHVRERPRPRFRAARPGARRAVRAGPHLRGRAEEAAPASRQRALRWPCGPGLAFPPSCPALAVLLPRSGSRAGRTTSGSGRPRRYPGATAIGTYRSHQKDWAARRRDRASRDPRRKAGSRGRFRSCCPRRGGAFAPGQSQIGMNGRAAGC